METWINLISNVGFPITCCCGLAYALWQMWIQIKTTCNTLTETNAKLVDTNANLVSSINEKIDKMNTKIDEVIEEVKSND